MALTRQAKESMNSRDYWEVIVDYFYGQWTYGVYPTEEQARKAAERCTHTQHTIRIRRA